MVDLVKVRKKAKEKAAEKAEGRGLKAEVASALPAAQRPSDPATKIARFLETAGQRRVTQKKETRPAVAQLELLMFELAGELYAIDIEHVVEIVTPRPVTRVPNADASIVGIISLRGMIVTLIDARSRLRHRATAAASAPDERVIVVDLAGENMGFVVDRVLRVVKIEADAVDAHPVVHTSEQEESVRGVFRHLGALTILLDLEKLLGVVVDGTYV
jgi:purine-binding chemotaxis protein CheW